VVTGASRGIGKVVARRLAMAGVSVVIAARHPKELQKVADGIDTRGGRILAIPNDLTQPSGVKSLIKKTIQKFDRIDILVDNLGGPLHFAPFLELTDADWYETLTLDLMVAVRLCREAIPWTRRQREGRIINIASIVGLEVTTKFPDYSVAKAALIAFGKYLSVAFASDNILVSTICPGAVWTSSWQREAEEMAIREGLSIEEAIQKLRSSTAEGIPLGRMGEPDDVASLVEFLSSPNLTWMTGSLLNMDGGASRRIS